MYVAGLEQGCQEVFDRVVEETSDRGRKLSGQLRGGEAVKARSGMMQVQRRKGVCRADRNLAAQRSAPAIGGTSLECGNARL